MLLLVGCTGLEPYCPAPPVAHPEAPRFRVVTLNVGNGDKRGAYGLRIRDQAYEDLVGDRLRALDADVVFLQEVLPPTVCDANRHVECVGVHRRFGRIPGVDGFSLDGAQTAELPGKPCDYLKGECAGTASTCDAESSVSTVLVQTERGPVRLIHAHPTAIGEVCLREQVGQAAAFQDENPTIAAGDWNFDPTRLLDVAPTAYWSQWVGPARRLRAHHPRRPSCRLESTSTSQDAALDRVATDFGQGRCTVLRDPPIDHGHERLDMTTEPIDHLAVVCDLVDLRAAPLGQR